MTRDDVLLAALLLVGFTVGAVCGWVTRALWR